MSVIYTLQPTLSYTDMSWGFGLWQRRCNNLLIILKAACWEAALEIRGQR